MHQHILIESISPCVDGGRYAAKGLAGEAVVVEADIFRDGHAFVRGVIHWRAKGETEFRQAPLEEVGNDRFRGSFPVAANKKIDPTSLPAYHALAKYLVANPG